MESSIARLPKEVILLPASRTRSPPKLKSLPIGRDSNGRSPLGTSAYIHKSTYNGGALQSPSSAVRTPRGQTLVMMMSPLSSDRSPATRSPRFNVHHGQLTGSSTTALLPPTTDQEDGLSCSSAADSTIQSAGAAAAATAELAVTHLERCLEVASGRSTSALICDQDPKCSQGIKGSVLSVCQAGRSADSRWWKGAVAYEGSPTGRAVSKAYPACRPVRLGDVEAVLSAVESRTVDRAMLPLAESEDEIGSSSCGALYHRIYDLILRHSGLHVVGAVHEYYDEAATGGVADRSYSLHASCRRFWVVSRDARMPATSREDSTYKTTVALVLSDGLGSLYKALAAFAFRGVHVTRLETRPWRQQPLLIKAPAHYTQSHSPVDPAITYNHVAHDNPTQSQYRHHAPTGPSTYNSHSTVAPAPVASSYSSTAYRYFQYVVFIDFQGSTADLSTQSVLAQLQQHCSFLRILGSYPTFDFHCRYPAFPTISPRNIPAAHDHHPQLSYLPSPRQQLLIA